MNGTFQNWWLARSAVPRKAMKCVLGCVAVVGLLLFVSFNLRGSGEADKGLKTRITVGQPHPWLVLEQFTPSAMSGVTNSPDMTKGLTANSSVTVLSSSFIAGMLSLYSMILLSRIGRIEKAG